MSSDPLFNRLEHASDMAVRSHWNQLFNAGSLASLLDSHSASPLNIALYLPGIDQGEEVIDHAGLEFDSDDLFTRLLEVAIQHAREHRRGRGEDCAVHMEYSANTTDQRAVRLK